MTAIIAYLLTSKIAQAIGALLVGLIAWRGNGAWQRRKGRRAEREEAQQEDYEHAEAIRNRVPANRADSLREMDGRGYRD